MGFGENGFEVSRILEKCETGNLVKWDFRKEGFWESWILGKSDSGKGEFWHKK